MQKLGDFWQSDPDDHKVETVKEGHQDAKKKNSNLEGRDWTAIEDFGYANVSGCHFLAP